MKNKQFLLIGTWLVIVLLTHLLKFNFPIGCQSASLRFIAITLPALAYFLPATLSLSLIGSAWLVLQIAYGTPLTVGIPTLFASLSWIASKEKGIKNLAMHVAVPLIAMGMYCFSEVGSGAWAYSLYWLIPIACAFLKTSPITRALQSTFLAHAAGSVIWVYLMPLSSEQWLALIPVVAVERIVSVVLSLGVISLVSFVANTATKPVLEKKTQTI